MILTAVALLKRKTQPTDTEIDSAMTNICRCGTYDRVRKAIHRAARAGDATSVSKGKRAEA
jgi:isoquinoline 1-oxidoreductase alpha subunit